jgi:DNA-binding LacI/PurR family transcriptional regulator
VKRPTISDIAHQAGVSKVAVSYALNGQPGVSEATRKRIVAIAEEIGFNPSSAAKALSGAAAQAIGLALCRPARTLGLEPFFMELISGVEAELSARSYALTLQVVADADAEVALYRRWWGERRVDGVLVCDLRDDDPRVPALEQLNLPAVVIGGPGHTGRLPNVWSDDAAAVVATIEYLYALGHRRIARVGGIPELLHTRIRTEAFTAVAGRLGLTDAISVTSDYSGEQGARATRRLLSSANRPTAIVFDNDVMAIAGLGVAQEMGLSVPTDLSIVAGDDSALCQLMHPPLTALWRDIPAYGAHAATLLLAAIAGRPYEPLQDETARLTPRRSTAPPPPALLASRSTPPSTAPAVRGRGKAQASPRKSLPRAPRKQQVPGTRTDLG